MAPKRKADIPTLDELLEKPWCYYCEKECSDLNSLQDHQKAMHLRCTLSYYEPHYRTCGKKMNTIGGLKVHSETVHKVPLPQVENAKPERASVDGPEIFLMQGIPIELTNKRRDDIITAYNEHAAKHFRDTGKALPGSIQEQHQQHQAPSKKAKVAVPQETPEQKKARLKEHIAKKRAEKAEREAAAKANGGVAVKQENGASLKHEDGVAIKQESKLDAPAQDMGTQVKPEPNSTPFTDYPAAPVASQPPVSQPMLGYPYQQGYHYGGPQFGYPPPTHYGQQPSFPPAPHAYPQQPFGYGGSPHGGYPPQPMASHSPISHPSPITKTDNSVEPQRKSTMPPAAPGLPQKPNFVTPSYSKDEMTKFHSGSAATKSLTGSAATRKQSSPAAAQNHAVAPTWKNLSAPAEAQDDPAFGSAETPTVDTHAKFLEDSKTILDHPHPQNMWSDPELVKSTQDIRDGLDDLVEGSDSKTVGQNAAEPVAAGSPAPAPTATKQGRAAVSKNSVRKYSDDVVSPEEKMSKQHKYAMLTPERRRGKAKGTVQEQADSQAVTGSVADDLEQ